jgi:hypothetical protein
MFIALEFRSFLSSGGAKCQKLRPSGACDHKGQSSYKHSAPTEPSQVLRTKAQSPKPFSRVIILPVESGNQSRAQ